MNAKKKTNLNFEAAMVELEELVAKIEEGNLPLEGSVKEFERGVELSRICQKALTDAEQRVKVLTDSLENEQTFQSISDS